LLPRFADRSIVPVVGRYDLIPEERRSCEPSAVGFYGHIDGHREIAVWSADKATGDRRCLVNVPRHGNTNQIATANRSVRRVVGDPTLARDIDVGPGVGRACADCGSRGVVEISRYDSGTEAETPGRFDQQDSEIAARSPAPVEGFDGGLCPLVFPA